LYFPINRSVTGGVVLATRWDPLVPFWPIWAVPYALSLLWWAGCFVWATWAMDTDRFRALAVGTIATMLTSYAVYLIYPTYVQRPALTGDGLPIDLLRFIYANDRVNNAFPSGHTYTTTLIVLFWWDWQPRLRWLWVGIALVVVLSTLFTGQHNLPDPVGGAIWAWAGYRFGMWYAARSSKGK
jgi:membrane-associated phospholipid phosphatase